MQTFDSLTRYTTTVLVETDWIVDLHHLLYHIDIPEIPQCEYVPSVLSTFELPESVFPAKTVRITEAESCVINVHHNSLFRGNILKKVTSSFKNAVSMNIYVQKQVNVKIPHRGKIQITGCTDERHQLQVMEYLTSILPHTGSDRMVFIPAINNYRFHLGFKIVKQKLHDFLYGREGIVTYSTNKHSALTISLEHEAPAQVLLVEEGEIYEAKMKAEIFTTTMMVFSTGSVLLMGKQPVLVREAFERIYSLILEYQAQLTPRES